MQQRQVRDIAYQLLPCADRQTTDIVIERDGQISVRAPLRMTPEQVEETVLSKRMWIYRNLADWRDLNATHVVREWVNGESFRYLGSSYRLQLVSEQDEPLKLKDGRFCLLRSDRIRWQGGRASGVRNLLQGKGAEPPHQAGDALCQQGWRAAAGHGSDQGYRLPLGLLPQERRPALSLEVPDGAANDHRLHRDA